MNLPPEKIIIPFEYENEVKTEYMSLELNDYVVDRVAPNGILKVLEGMEQDDLDRTTIAFWIPSRYGWDVSWRISGRQFLERHVLSEIKPS